MLDQFTPVGPVDITGGSAIDSDGQSAMEELQAEMKLLNWHKLANEAALKAALIRTKSLKAEDRQVTKQNPNEMQEKAAWMSQVIEEEQRKPLQVTKEFVTNYAAEERKREDRLQSEVERQIEGLQRLKKQIADREEHRGRKEKYREAAKALNEEKKQMAHGKYGSATKLEPLEKEKPSKPKSTLATVINSLDKLVELERRITGLENDSLYDRMGDTSAFPSVAQSHASEAAPSVFKAQTGPLRFSKKQAPPGLNAPSQTLFSVKVANNRGARGVRGRNTKASTGGYRVKSVKPIPKAGSSLTAVKARGRKPLANRSQSSTFMTGVPKQSASSSRLMGGGRGACMSRRDKKGQDAQISSWLSQKKGKNSRVKTTTERNNMRGFQELRGQMDKRKDDMRKNVARNKSSGYTTLPSIRQRNVSTTGSVFNKSTANSSRQSRSVARSSSLIRGSSVSRSTTTGSRLPKVGGASAKPTKARRKAW